MRCPYCNTELEVDEIIESEGYFDYVGGHCPQCDKLFSWGKHYKRVLESETDLIEN